MALRPHKRRLGRPLEPYDNVVAGPWPMFLCEGCRERRPVERCSAGDAARDPYWFCAWCLATEKSSAHALSTARRYRRAAERW